MHITKVTTTLEQRTAAKNAAQQRYDYNRYTPDRPGWTGGKCPVNEYRAILGELGAANALAYDWHDLCLFSTDKEDFTRPDMGDWEVKAGSTFSLKDIQKGAKYILWVNPINTGHTFMCGYDTCNDKVHVTMQGDVEIRGWTDLAEDLRHCSDFGSYFKPAGAAMRNADTLPKVVWL